MLKRSNNKTRKRNRRIKKYNKRLTNCYFKYEEITRVDLLLESEQIMKVIFLDIDGVLNNQNHLINIMKLLGREQYLDILRSIHELPFDFRSCELINRLIKNTNAKVVLSSTWRLNPNHIETIKKYAGIEIYDITPRLQTSRGEEIKEYLNRNKNIDNYVIIDDDNDMLEEQKYNFVKVNGIIGFTENEYIKCLNIMKQKHKYHGIKLRNITD